MARPTKYTPARAAKIIEGLKAGMTRTAAAGLADIDVGSLDNWCKRYSSFCAQVVVAEQHAEAFYTSVVAKAAKEGDVQAARYWLSRRRRKDWGDSLHVNLDQEITKLLEQIAGASSSDADTTDSN